MKPQTREMQVLLISLLFMLLFVPMLDVYVVSGYFRPIGLTFVIVAVFWMFNRQPQHEFPIGLAVVLVLIPIVWTTLWVENRWLFAISSLLSSGFFLFAALRLLARVFERHVNTLQAVWGAICVYLLLGLSWAMIYWALIALDANSLAWSQIESNPARAPAIPPLALSQVVYFSFVTMSTLGYGDMVPLSPLAEMATWMQSVSGQFYMAVFVARLVSSLPRPD
jgi:voltage-gated potassium channel